MCCLVSLAGGHFPTLYTTLLLLAGQQDVGAQKCLSCPTGSVAKTNGGLIGQDGSTYCDPW